MLELKNGLLHLTGSPLGGGAISFEFDDGALRTPEWQKQGSVWRAALDNGLEVVLRLGEETLDAEFQNGKNALFLQKIRIDFAPTLPAVDYKEYTHSRLFLEQASGVKPVGLRTALFEHNPTSYVAYLAADNARKDHFLFAALPPHQGEFMTFKARHDSPAMRGNFGVEVVIEEDRSIAPGAKFNLSTLLIRHCGGDPMLLLEDLGDRYAAARRKPLKPRAVGWNSWDQFHGSITAGDVLETQRRLDEFSGHKVRYYVVDDGWQIAYGAWIPNLKFPSDLGEFCRKVAAQGGIPGIWTAPLLVDRDSMYPQEWVVRASDDKLVFDVTHPEAAKHLSATYRRLYEAGFRYFKVDFTNCILNAPRLHDMSMGRAGALRKTYELIREAIGEDSYFLGCCVPYEPAFGAVDAVRTTADIQIYWSAVQINMTSASARWWLHRKLWNNDSDFLVVRGPETAEGVFNPGRPFTKGDYASGPVLSRTEAMSLALALHMTAGDLMFSDNFLKLNDEGKRIMQAMLALEPLALAARPADLFSAPCGEIPAFWLAAPEKKLAVFNWEEDEREFTVDPGKYGFSRVGGSFWGETALTAVPNGGVKFTLKPHQSAGLILA